MTGDFIFLLMAKWINTCLKIPLRSGTDMLSEECPQFSSVLSLSHVQLFAIPWTAAYQASLSITNSQNLFKLMPIESVMPSNHLILSSPFPLSFNPSQHQGLFK